MSEKENEYPFNHHQKIWLEGRFVDKKTYDMFVTAQGKCAESDNIRLTKLETSIGTTLKIVQMLIVPIVMMFLTQFINFIQK